VSSCIKVALRELSPLLWRRLRVAGNTPPARRQGHEMKEHPRFVSGCPNQWAKIPKSAKPLTVGIYRGCVRVNPVGSPVLCIDNLI